MLGEAALDVSGTFLGEAIRFLIPFVAQHPTTVAATARRSSGIPTTPRPALLATSTTIMWIRGISLAAPQPFYANSPRSTLANKRSLSQDGP
jgi:hypothetical protein